MFVECKLGRLDIASQTEIAAEPPFVAAIQRLAGNVGQLYATRGAGGRLSALETRRPTGSSGHLTFHEWFCFGPFFYKHLDALVDAEFEKRGLDASLLPRHPYSVCSIAEFEGC